MTNCGYKLKPRGMTGGWEPVGDKPVLGGALGTCFDCYVMQEDGIYKIWFSWRPTRCIAYAESPDGIHWDNPRVVLTAVTGSSWEGHEVNRPTIVKKDGIYHMWYTGQMFAKETNSARSCIGYATSLDGIHWERRSCFGSRASMGKNYSYVSSCIMGRGDALLSDVVFWWTHA